MPSQQFFLGALLNPPDERDYLASLVLPVVTIEPDPIDWSVKTGPIFDQGQRGTCVVNAHVSQSHFTELPLPDVTCLSREYLWKRAKETDGIPLEDGTYPRAAYLMAQKWGIPEERFMPYGGTIQLGADVAAAAHRIGAFSTVHKIVDNICQALVFAPVGVSIKVYQSFYSPPHDGIFRDMSGQFIGYHRVLLVGKDRAKGLFKFQNSHGSRYGLHGYFYMSFDLLSIMLDMNIQTDYPSYEKHWSDWPDGWLAEQDLVYRTLAIDKKPLMRGYSDGTIHPSDSISIRQVATVLGRLGLPIDPTYLENYWPAERGWIHQVFPQLTFEEDRWTEQLTRFQFVLLLARYIATNV
jgi:hypothetical protein